jgi:hypothetical protein
MKSFQTIAEAVPGSDEVFVKLPDEFLTFHDWREGDALEYGEPAADGSMSIVNKTLAGRKAAVEKEGTIYVVEMLVSHRVRMAVKATSLEQAIAVAKAREGEDFDQNHLGTEVFSARPVSRQEYLDSFDCPPDESMKMSMVIDPAAAPKL